MGLDMYLSKKTYVKQWDHQSPQGRFEVTVTKGGEPVETIKPERVSYVIEEIAYWRKANHIHRWFVEHVQNGVDECQPSYVEIEQLTELRDLCAEVLDMRTNVKWVQENLPTASGFFFGGTEYDEYYWQAVEYTRDTLSAILVEPDSDDGEYEYQSSW